MKSFIKTIFCTALIAASACAAALCGCGKKSDYSDCISEKRSEIYLYSDDEAKAEIRCVAREQPYNADGICGEICDLVEVYVYLNAPAESVEVDLLGYSGEMNYEAVDKRFSVSYSAPPFNADGVSLKISVDGKEKEFKALSVKDGGTISCEQAVEYAAEYDKELFESLNSKSGFAGEIFVRLLYDEGCYYYVGVCDRDKNISAYLLDGGTGKVITTKKISSAN